MIQQQSIIKESAWSIPAMTFRHLSIREPLDSQTNQTALLQIYSDLQKGFLVVLGDIEFNTRSQFNQWLDKGAQRGWWL